MSRLFFLAIMVPTLFCMRTTELLAAPCAEKSPRNKDGERDGVHVMCQGGGAWEETTFKNGVQEGPMRSYHGNGKLRELKHYKGGKQHGPLKKYFDNGQLEEESNYVEYYKDGVSKHFDEKGTLLEETNWRGGKRHGVRKIFDSRSGRLESKETYKDDKRDGPSERYGDNGKPVEIRNYVKDEWHGLQQKFNSNGKLEESDQYSDGKHDGWSLRYYDNADGYYLYSASFDVNGRRSFYATFFANGKKREFTCYDKDEKAVAGTELCTKEVKDLQKILSSNGMKAPADSNDDETEYYSNGKPQRKCAVKNGKRHGKCATFYEDGTPSWTAEYKDGTIHGESVDYWGNGKPKKKKLRDGSGGVSRIIEYYEEGQKKKDSVIQNDRETSATEFFMNGNPSLEFKWLGDQQSVVRYHDNGKPSLKVSLIATTQCSYSCWDSMSYDGILSRYDDDGTQTEKTEYKKGKREGRSIFYWPNGKVREESTYKNDRLISEKSYAKDGKLEGEIEYFPDGSKRVKKQ